MNDNLYEIVKAKEKFKTLYPGVIVGISAKGLEVRVTEKQLRKLKLEKLENKEFPNEIDGIKVNVWIVDEINFNFK